MNFWRRYRLQRKLNRAYWRTQAVADELHSAGEDVWERRRLAGELDDLCNAAWRGELDSTANCEERQERTP